MNAGRHGDEKFEYDEEHCDTDHGAHAVMRMNGRGQENIFSAPCHHLLAIMMI